MKDALNRSGSAGKKQTEKTYNLDFPENHPSDEASMARARRARLWPPREVEAAKRWVEEPLAAALEKAAAGDRRTLIVLHGPRGAGFPEVFAQVLPGVSSAILTTNMRGWMPRMRPWGFWSAMKTCRFCFCETCTVRPAFCLICWRRREARTQALRGAAPRQSL